MKIKRTMFAAVLTAMILLILCSLSACRAKNEPIVFGVLAFSDNPNTRVDLFYSEADDRYYLFLPADADRGSLKVVCDGSVTVNGAELANGQPTDVFASGEMFQMDVGGNSLSVQLLQAENLPSVFLQTESGSLQNIHSDKSYKEPGSFTLSEGGAITINAAELNYIKGRGSTTWEGEKKPYNIKFEKKTDICKMGAAKKWALLAVDSLALRDSVGLDFASELRFSYTPEWQYVDLYINGEYKGLYLIAEKAEVNKERLSIFDLDDANKEANPGVTLSDLPQWKSGAAETSRENFGSLLAGERRWYQIAKDPEDITKGYLFELTDPTSEKSAFCSARNLFYQIKTPEYASEQEANYIADLYQQAEDALYSEDGYNQLGRYYLDYFDLDSLVDMYILREYTQDLDAGICSTFLYKPGKEDKFYFGPPWDFNSAFGWYPALSDEEPERWWANSRLYLGYTSLQVLQFFNHPDESSFPTVGLFVAAYRHEDFRAFVSARWMELSSNIDNRIPRIMQTEKTISMSKQMNIIRWQDSSGNSAGMPGFKKQKDELKGLVDFLSRRRKALDKGFSDEAAMLYYDSNGGFGYSFCRDVLRVGDRVVLANIDKHSKDGILLGLLLNQERVINDYLLRPSSSNDVFVGWNTKPDGSGEMYQPGDAFTVTSRTNVLYAQWVKK